MENKKLPRNFKSKSTVPGRPAHIQDYCTWYNQDFHKLARGCSDGEAGPRRKEERSAGPGETARQGCTDVVREVVLPYVGLALFYLSCGGRRDGGQRLCGRA